MLGSRIPQLTSAASSARRVKSHSPRPATSLQGTQTAIAAQIERQSPPVAAESDRQASDLILPGRIIVEVPHDTAGLGRTHTDNN